MRRAAIGLTVVLTGCGGTPADPTGTGSDTSTSTGSAASEAVTDASGAESSSEAVPTTMSQTTGPGPDSSTGSTSTGEDPTTSATGSEAGSSSTGDEPPPVKPAELVSYLTGDPADALINPTGPGLIVMGGSTDVDAAFDWQLQYIGGGDVVVLRTSGADGYNDYLFGDIGGIDSVETLMVTSKELAMDPYVAWTVAHAEAVFMAGGDQATYLKAWKDTPVEDAIAEVYARGGVVGGTSAGAAVLGELIYAAYNDSVIEDEALLDPFNKYMSFERDFLAFAPLQRVITDTHFTARRRLCRLIGFVARMVVDDWGDPVLGLGVDEQTALVIGPDGLGTVLGVGGVHLLHSAGEPQQCVPGETLEYAGLDLYSMKPGDTVQLPAGVPNEVAAVKLSASMGALDPAYDCVD